MVLRLVAAIAPALLLAILPCHARGDAPAPCGLCAGKQEGEACLSTHYYQGGKCVKAATAGLSYCSDGGEMLECSGETIASSGGCVSSPAPIAAASGLAMLIWLALPAMRLRRSRRS